MLLLVDLSAQRSDLPFEPVIRALQLDALHLQIAGLFLEHTDLLSELIVSLLHHIKLLFQALVLPMLAFKLHVLLPNGKLVLGNSLLRLLQLLLQLVPRLNQLVVLLLQVELDYVLILELHLLGLYLAHLVEDFVFLRILGHFCFSDAGHKRVVLLAQLYLVLLLHLQLVLQGRDAGNKSLSLKIERFCPIDSAIAAILRRSAGLITGPFQTFEELNLTAEVVHLHFELDVLVAQLEAVLLTLEHLLVGHLNLGIFLLHCGFESLRFVQEGVEFVVQFLKDVFVLYDRKV